MDPQRLTYMVNQIARNFEHTSDPVQATLQHIKDFWDPRMIAGLLSAEHTELGSIASAAVRQLSRN
jgi:formate dehydrogenase subunit delta